MSIYALEEPVTLPDPSTLVGLISSVLGGAIVFALVALWRMMKSRVDRMVSQVENEHQDAEFPNLREELTAVRIAVESSEVNTRMTRQELGSLREDHRDLSRRLDRHISDPCGESR